MLYNFTLFHEEFFPLNFAVHHEKVYVNGIPTYGIDVKIENEAFTVVGSGCRQNLKFVFSHKVFFLQNTLRKCTKLRAACAEQ